MRYRLLLAVVAFIGLQFFFGSKASAQGPFVNPCANPIIWYFPDPIPFGWWVYSPVGQGNYSYYLAAWACPSKERPSCNCPMGGQPISLSTGSTYIAQVDIKIPGIGGGLSLARTWNSILAASL